MRTSAPTAGTLAATRWRPRPRLALALRALTAAVPFVASVLVVRFVQRRLPPADGLLELLVLWVELCAVGTATMLLVDRFSRRLLPLAALLRVSLVFPDAAPSRFRTALRTGTVAQLERRIEEAAEGRAGSTPMEAATALVELVAALNRHDRLTRGHSERVRAYARLIGEELGFDDEKLELLHWAALVHDVGKVVVPREVLNKPGRLTDDEFDLIKQHPEAGARLVEPLRDWLGEWTLAVLEHHERWDGRGYPNGLAGDEISLAGRIVAVADVFDVITSARSYRVPVSADEARREIARCAGSQFDPTVVRAFLNIGIGRLRLLVGPLAWLQQVRLLRDLPLGPAAASIGGVVASVVAAAGFGAGPADAASPATVVAAAVEAPVEASPTTIAPTTTVRSAPPPTLAPSRPPATTATTLPPAEPAEQAEPVAVPTTAPPPPPTTVLPPPVFAPPTTAAPPQHAPVAGPDAATVAEDGSLVLDVLANDRDADGETLHLAWLETAAHGQAVGTGRTLTYTPAPDWSGVEVLGYVVADPRGAATRGQVTITVRAVNDAPLVVVPPLLTIAEDGGPTTVAGWAAASAGPADEPQGLTFDVDASVDLFGADPVVDPATGTLRFTPAPDAAGSSTLTVTVDDGELRASATAVVVVTPVPDAPAPVGDTLTTAEDTPASVAPAANDADADGDPLTLTWVAAASHGVATVTSGAVEYVPDPDWSGTESLLYRVEDPGGLDALGVLTVTVLPVDDPPTLAALAPVTVAEDSGAAAIGAWAAMTGGPPDEAQAVTVTTSTDVDLFAVDPAVDPATGALTFVPAPDVAGVAVVTVTVTDAGGGQATGQGSIAISPVDDAPIAGPDALVLDEGETATVDLLGNDTDADGEPLVVTAVDPPALADATLTWDATGALTYGAPGAGGTDTIGYTVADPDGTTAQGTLTVTVTPTPDDPVAHDDAYATDGSPLAVAAPGLLANDGDEDGDVLQIVDVAPATSPAGTLAVLADGSFTFTPAGGFAGTGTWTYTVDDGTGRLASATVSVTVAPVSTTSSLRLAANGTLAPGGGSPGPVPDDPADADADPGRTVSPGGGNALAQLLSRPDRFAVWSTGSLAAPLVLDGPASLDLWSTVADYEPDKAADLWLWLQDCDATGLLCTTVAEIDHVHVDEWNGGVAGFVESTWSLGDLDHTVPVGHQLRIVLAVGHHDVWFATGGSTASALVLSSAST